MTRILILIVTLAAFQSCEILQQGTATNPTPTKAKINKPTKVKETINNHVYSVFQDKGSLTGYQFGELYFFKPQEIKDLDKLIEEKNNLPNLVGDYNEELDEKLEIQEKKIAKQKKKLKDENIFPWYEQRWIFAVTFLNDSTQLYEYNFEVYPNYKIKDVKEQMSVHLSKSELSTFEYFINQNPLFESDTDYRWANEMNAKMYDQLFAALEAEKDHKSELLKTILNMVTYIQKKNSFDENNYTKEFVIKWEKENLKNYEDIISLKRTPLQQITTNIDDIDVLTGYQIKHSFVRSGSSDVKVLIFNFDLNFVLLNAIETNKNDANE